MRVQSEGQSAALTSITHYSARTHLTNGKQALKRLLHIQLLGLHQLVRPLRFRHDLWQQFVLWRNSVPHLACHEEGALLSMVHAWPAAGGPSSAHDAYRAPKSKRCKAAWGTD